MARGWVASVVFASVLYGVVAEASASANGSEVQTATKCLTSHRALVTRVAPSRDFRSAPGIGVSFALVPGRRSDQVTIFFEPSERVAKTVAANLRRKFARIPNFSDYLTRSSSRLLLWGSVNRASASESAIAACLKR